MKSHELEHLCGHILPSTFYFLINNEGWCGSCVLERVEPCSVLMERHVFAFLCDWIFLNGDEQTGNTHCAFILCWIPILFEFLSTLQHVLLLWLSWYSPFPKLPPLCSSPVIGVFLLNLTLLCIHTFLLGSEFMDTNENKYLFTPPHWRVLEIGQTRGGRS